MSQGRDELRLGEPLGPYADFTFTWSAVSKELTRALKASQKGFQKGLTFKPQKVQRGVVDIFILNWNEQNLWKESIILSNSSDHPSPVTNYPVKRNWVYGCPVWGIVRKNTCKFGYACCYYCSRGQKLSFLLLTVSGTVEPYYFELSVAYKRSVSNERNYSPTNSYFRRRWWWWSSSSSSSS